MKLVFRPPQRTINTVTAPPSSSIRAASIFTGHRSRISSFTQQRRQPPRMSSRTTIFVRDHHDSAAHTIFSPPHLQRRATISVRTCTSSNPPSDSRPPRDLHVLCTSRSSHGCTSSATINSTTTFTSQQRNFSPPPFAQPPLQQRAHSSHRSAPPAAIVRAPATTAPTGAAAIAVSRAAKGGRRKGQKP